MTALETHTTVGDLVAQKPSRSRVFERLGIDYCCGGKKPLDQACAEKGLDTQTVLRELRASDTHAPSNDLDLTTLPLAQLCDHIEAAHHEYLKRELPRLATLLAKIADVHGQNHPELRQARDVYDGLKAELDDHMAKEEQILFPMIRQLQGASTQPCFHCGSVGNPISVMEHEHDNAGAALATLRRLTRDYSTPGDGCNTYRAAMDGLAQLEADLHQHIHKENNILHPRAIAREKQLQR